jgi:hypothetical protein
MEALILVAESGGPAILARIGGLRALTATTSASSIRRERIRTGPAQTQRGSAMTVFVYVNTSKPAGGVTTSRCVQTRLPRKRAAAHPDLSP